MGFWLRIDSFGFSFDPLVCCVRLHVARVFLFFGSPIETVSQEGPSVSNGRWKGNQKHLHHVRDQNAFGDPWSILSHARDENSIIPNAAASLNLPGHWTMA